MENTICQRGAASAHVKPRFDVVTNGDHLVLKVYLPGVDKAAVDLKVESSRLYLAAEASQLPNEWKPVYLESRPSAYKAQWDLSQKLDISALEAKYENGVLEVRLPHKQEEQARQLKIQ